MYVKKKNRATGTKNYTIQYKSTYSIFQKNDKANSNEGHCKHVSCREFWKILSNLFLDSKIKEILLSKVLKSL